MSFDDVVAAFLDGIALGLRGISEVSTMFASWGDRLQADGTSWRVFLVEVAAVLGVAVLAGWILRRGLALAVARRLKERTDAIGRLRLALRELVLDVVAALAIAVIAHGAFAFLAPPGTLARHTAFALAGALLVSIAYMALARFLFAPREPAARLVDIAHARWHWSMLVLYGVLGAVVGQVVRLATATGVDPVALEGFFLAGATAMTAQKLVWFILGGSDMRHAFAGPAPGPARRIAAALMPTFYIATALVIWGVGFLTAGRSQSAAWSFAAGGTQILLLVLPIAGFGVHTLAVALVARLGRTEGVSPMQMAAARGAASLVTGGVWLAGLYGVLLFWRPVLVDGAGLAAIGGVASLLKVLATVVVCIAAWSAINAHIAAYAPPEGPAIPGMEADDHGTETASRLATVLPLIRNMILIALIAIAALIVLSSLGLDIGPLLAGFGIFGLAISFGSQALVRDIVSGIFFIADDAFRRGEYVDTGRLKGTVERISLRSLQLRHQNGPLHTIPFGQIQSVTNYSRDWSTVKFELRFDRDSDPEKIRKVVKKVGLAMLDDEEFGSEFLVPLKMQGIQDVTDSALVVRLKFTAKPGNPSLIQREAIKRLLIAFKENGLMLASNAVTVRGDQGASGAGAAAAEVARIAAERAALGEASS